MCITREWVLLALPVHILQHSPIQSFSHFHVRKISLDHIIGTHFEFYSTPIRRLVILFFFMCVCWSGFLVFIAYFMYPNFFCYIYIYDARVSPYLLCDSLFIFQLLWHFCDKKGKNIKYLTHLKKREGRSLKMGDHWILNSF